VNVCESVQITVVPIRVVDVAFPPHVAAAVVAVAELAVSNVFRVHRVSHTSPETERN